MPPLSILHNFSLFPALFEPTDSFNSVPAAAGVQLPVVLPFGEPLCCGSTLIRVISILSISACGGPGPFRHQEQSLQGLSSALDTLGSQAYGANNRAGVISWSVTTTLVMSVLAVPMAVVLYFGDALAIHVFQQPQEIADVRLPHTIPESGPAFAANLRRSAMLVFCQLFGVGAETFSTDDK